MLRRFLATQGVRIENERFRELGSRTSVADRFIRPAIAILSRLKCHFPAVHITFGAINGREGIERLATVDATIAPLPGLDWFDLGAKYAGNVQSARRLSHAPVQPIQV